RASCAARANPPRRLVRGYRRSRPGRGFDRGQRRRSGERRGAGVLRLLSGPRGARARAQAICRAGGRTGQADRRAIRGSLLDRHEFPAGRCRMRELSAEDIEALAVGAWILGTGGGGSPYHALLNMRRLYREGVRVSLMDPEALEDDDDVAVVSNMGAPLVTPERVTDSRMIARAVEVMQDYLGRRFRGVMGIEIGGGNSIQPLMAAAHLGIPVVDADAMGRAYPEAQMTSFAVGDLTPAPLTSVDPRGNEAIVTRAANWKWMERTSRKICTEFGSVAATCKAQRRGAEVKRWGIRGTTTKAIRLGQAVIEANRRHQDPIETILRAERGKRLFAGKIVEVERRTTEGFLRGRTAIEGEGRERIRIDFQNEWTVVW